MARLTLLLATLTWCCAATTPLPVEPEPDLPAGGAPSTDGTPCGQACAVLAALHCPEGEPTPAGATCEAVCDNARDALFDLNESCVARATSVSAVRGCGVECRR